MAGNRKKIKNYLIKYKNIQIRDFEIDNICYFNVFSKKYILDKFERLEYNYSTEDSKIYQEINNFRKKNNINQLKSNSAVKLIYYFDKIEHFFSLGNLFQFNNYKTYLFVYPIGEFEYKLRNNDDVIIKILKIKSLNYIIILEKENNEYILIFEEKQYIIKSMNNDIQLSSRSNTSNVLLINNFAI